MKNTLFSLIFLLLSNFNFAQVKNGYYTGNLVDEFVWSNTKAEYVHLESIPMYTEIFFSTSKIYFKKGKNAKWHQNKWEFDQTVTYDDGKTYDRYFDERNQMILIDYKSSQILYYYNWDIHTENYSNIAIYKNLVESNDNETNSSNSLEQVVLAKFIITDASFNGIDNTPTILDQGSYTVFYTFQNDGLNYMANYWPKNNSQSYGPLYSAESVSYDETYETYKSDIFYFNWRYTNDYDGKKGTAKVQLTKIYKTQGVAFVLKIIPENLDMIIYKGYMEGTVDFSKF